MTINRITAKVLFGQNVSVGLNYVNLLMLKIYLEEKNFLRGYVYINGKIKLVDRTNMLQGYGMFSILRFEIFIIV